MDALSCPLGYFPTHFPRVPGHTFACVMEAESVFPYGESSQMLVSHLIILQVANLGAQPACSLPAACLHWWLHVALQREPVATKFSCGFLADGGGGDPLHCSIEKQMRILNALQVLTRGWGREKMTFFFLVLRIRLTLFCFSPARFLCCAETSTVAALYNYSLHIFAPPAFLWRAARSKWL